MEILHGILLVIHLIGWAIVLGGVLTNMRPPRIANGVTHGALTALVTGILLTGLIEMSDAFAEPNHMKIGIKLVIALVVTAMAIVGARREKVSAGFLGGLGALVVVNIALAILW